MSARKDRARQAQAETYQRRVGPPGPSLVDQQEAGSRAAEDTVAEVERLTDYAANVVSRMRCAVLYGVEPLVPDDPDAPNGVRNLTEEDAGAIIGVLRTLQVTLANVDVAVARIVGEQPLAAQPRESWPVSL